ncbi:hypothetical protein [Neobacillus sp. FSL H8-0543]|uniref:hypothetical protein n=1 Tax=Neobacillus sp. FSL H8-0543 TaxID=2954672 RepID=UPI0031590AD6
MKKFSTVLTILIVCLLAVSIYKYKNPPAQESITFFPIDPKVNFIKTETILSPLNKPTNFILWTIHSTLDQKAYLRQDAGLLFANGRLTGQLSDWKQNTAALIQDDQIATEKSTLLQAITFHHAELHEKGDQIFSSQAMSADQLYVVHSNPFKTFRVPSNKNEEQWKQQLDAETERMLQLSWNNGIRYFSIPLKNYEVLPFSQFHERAKTTLPGFSKPETARIVGNLWEGLYKNYILGIKKADGTIITPLGSTIPLILLAKDKTHLLVLTETGKGEPILLRQIIEEAD